MSMCRKCDVEKLIEVAPGPLGEGVEVEFCPFCTVETLRAQRDALRQALEKIAAMEWPDSCKGGTVLVDNYTVAQLMDKLTEVARFAQDALDAVKEKT